MAGRPPKPEADRRTEFLQIRLTVDELRLLDDVARDANTSTWARDELLRLARRRMKRKPLA